MSLDQAAIAKAVTDALTVSTSIPPGHKGAFVTIVDDSGVKAVVADKISGVWTVTGYVEHPWSGGLDYGTTLQASW